MFNQAGFNLFHFNRAVIVEIYGNFNIELKNRIDFKGTLEVNSGFAIASNLDVDFKGVADKISFFLLKQNLDTEFNAVREVIDTFTINTKLELEFSGGRVLINAIKFIGDFEPGQKIIIDMDKFTVTLDEQNALHLIEGDFMNLEPGISELIYEDVESSRQVKIQVEYRNRWL